MAFVLCGDRGNADGVGGRVSMLHSETSSVTVLGILCPTCMAFNSIGVPAQQAVREIGCCGNWKCFRRRLWKNVFFTSTLSVKVHVVRSLQHPARNRGILWVPNLLSIGTSLVIMHDSVPLFSESNSVKTNFPVFWEMKVVF